MNFIKKWLSSPSGETVKLEAVELWYVRWTRRYGQYSGDTEEVMEAFTNYADAVHFKEQLQEAFKLIRHTSGKYVEIEKS